MDNFTKFRTTVRNNSKTVIDHIFDHHISQTPKAHQSICKFCGSPSDLTKEHVIPSWAYQNTTKRNFTTDINGHSSTYNKTTIPACATCNNNLLSNIESTVINIFSQIFKNNYSYTYDEVADIIRWLETIDYKFQIVNARKRFINHPKLGHNKLLAPIPLTVMRDCIDHDPYKAISEIRRSRKRLTVKNKDKHINSLQILKTSNTSFYFFHTLDDFIFIELPQFKIALFYFYKRTFPTQEEAQKEAKSIVQEVYK